ncbi:MAG: hypothetical protein M1825_004161 [Sarcosagium campestre]|nr:MAG: hypothetical protein M1825_004161 [Sarcosagium campestre]
MVAAVEENGDVLENHDKPLNPIRADMDVADTGIETGNGSQSVDVTGSQAAKAEVVQGGPTSGDAPTMSLLLPLRPQIHRNQPQPPPPQQPPPPPAPVAPQLQEQDQQDGQEQISQQQQQQQQQQAGDPTDSLSLMQLKRIVTDMPKIEPTAYAFTYADATSFPEELEEWFPYTTEDRVALMRAKTCFEQKWSAFTKIEASNGLLWTEASLPQQKRFVGRQVHGLEDPDIHTREPCLAALTYIGLGVWGETMRLEAEAESDIDHVDPALEPDRNRRFDSSIVQRTWMQKGAEILQSAMALQAIFDVLRTACARQWTTRLPEATQEHAELLGFETLELTNVLTLIYLMVEAGRSQSDAQSGSIRDDLATLDPNYLIYLVKLIARLRWEEAPELPLTKILLVFWKSILLIFGGTKELDAAKASYKEHPRRGSNDGTKVLITASPLDYHVFRQEITSKYPAYNPPPPLLPLELDNNSVLPPLASHYSRNGGSVSSASGLGPANVSGNGGSILHQPVHIATPAPSPPPSPIGPGGKAGKKQNYQTNQNFPFLYPPASIDDGVFGDKVNLSINGAIPDRKWGGSDIPASIFEAGELFAGRMRMTRAIKQMWDQREEYMKFERGWTAFGDGDDEPGESDADKADTGKGSSPIHGCDDGLDADLRWRLARVEEFYSDSLPHLQSVVIVVLKLILANLTSVITHQNSAPQSAPPNGLGAGFQPGENTRNKGRENGLQAGEGLLSGDAERDPEADLNSVEDIESARSREKDAKAVSGILILLLRWFKASHVLKFEYLTQLLLDSNYMPLILKLFAHQDIDQAIESQTEKEELSFFRFCREEVVEPNKQGFQEKKDADESDDEACPPPIVRRSRADTAPSAPPAVRASSPIELDGQRQEVDEQGNPVAQQPITSFSWRNFFSSINFLRILQKICKNKAHRILLLVQYKSSTILKKCLKVPQPELRLYTLKLFKNQVPYCGRKWRQTNMRVITAVYLHCRPELRDDWLAGSDVDAEVEEALPLEQALRALTHWYNLKGYPEMMGTGTGVLEEEEDFFARELDKMDFGDDASAGGEGNGDGAWQGPSHLDAWAS